MKKLKPLKPLKEIKAEIAKRKAEKEARSKEFWGKINLNVVEFKAPEAKQPKRNKRRNKRSGRRYSGERFKVYNRQVKAFPGSPNKIYKGERKMRELLDVHFGSQPHINNCRPPWLINPVTGSLLELDRYYPELKLAFEYQGDQHYRFSPELQHDEQEFRAQVKRDEVKRKICKQQGVFLCYVHHNDLTPAGFQWLIDCLERAKTAGEFWSGMRAVEEINTTRKPAPERFSRKAKAARKHVIGQSTSQNVV